MQMQDFSEAYYLQRHYTIYFINKPDFLRGFGWVALFFCGSAAPLLNLSAQLLGAGSVGHGGYFAVMLDVL